MQEQNNVPDIKREDWDVERLANESANKPTDEIVREVLRGDEAKGNPDTRDIVGSVDSKDTPQGREETKKNETANNQ